MTGVPQCGGIIQPHLPQLADQLVNGVGLARYHLLIGGQCTVDGICGWGHQTPTIIVKELLDLIVLFCVDTHSLLYTRWYT